MPEEAIELADALTAFTAGSAYANHLDEAGVARRRAGWRTSRSSTATCSTAVPAGSRDTRVVATFVDGVAVHETPALEG